MNNRYSQYVTKLLGLLVLRTHRFLNGQLGKRLHAACRTNRKRSPEEEASYAEALREMRAGSCRDRIAKGECLMKAKGKTET